MSNLICGIFLLAIHGLSTIVADFIFSNLISLSIFFACPKTNLFVVRYILQSRHEETALFPTSYDAENILMSSSSDSNSGVTGFFLTKSIECLIIIPPTLRHPRENWDLVYSLDSRLRGNDMFLCFHSRSLPF